MIIITLEHDLHDAPADEVADRVEVVGRPREHLPGRVAVVERARIGQVRVVERGAQAVLDHDADARGDRAPRRVGERSAGTRRPRSARGRARARSGSFATIELSITRWTSTGIAIPSAGRRERAQQADADETTLHPPLAREMARGRAEAQVRRIDRTDWCSDGHTGRVPSAPLSARATMPCGTAARAMTARRRATRRPPGARAAAARRARSPRRRGGRSRPAPEPRGSGFRG